MVLALGAQGHWFESYPDFIFLPCIYTFVSLLWTLFVRLSIALFRNSSKNLICIKFVIPMAKKKKIKNFKNLLVRNRHA